MNRDTERAKEIFCTALDFFPDGPWAPYLDSACEGDADIRRRVETLLQAHAEMGTFHDSVDGMPPPLETPLVQEGPGTVIGPYKLREELAEGGMGVVYVAEQLTPVTRKVALKVIKPGMDTKQVIARFEAERQALAMMDHPNIAKVLDAGSTESGRPYFVMDLVRGLPLTEYCDKWKLSTRQRLTLFEDVCRAVQHAHQKGIIHRDIKPTNVLVTRNGDRAVPKVIDFGVAKAINQRLTEQSIYTRFSQMIGTPLYMSPEQAELSELDVDTRSDVYSLGVVLYELLTSITPFEKEQLNSENFDEIRRIIREDEPPRPSDRVSTLSDEALSTICDQHRCDVEYFREHLRGELDWIVMKAIEKDRTRRYESASAFAADVQRFLDDEPVAACPPSISYRLQKFARRNKAAVTTVGIVVLALLLGIAGTSWQAFQATTQRDEKQAALLKLEEALKEKQEALAAAEANLQMANNERKRAEANLQLTMRAVDDVYLQSIGEEKLLRLQSDMRMFPTDAMEMEFHPPAASRLELSEQDLELIQRGLAFYEQIAQQNPTSQMARFESARALSRVALLRTSLGENEQAKKAYTDAISRLEKLTTRRLDYFLELGRTYYQLGQLSRWWPQASNTFDAAVNAAKQSIELDPQSIEAYRLLGKAHIARNEYDLAVADFEKAVELDPDNAAFHHDLGRLLFHMGEYDRALPYAKQAVELDPKNNAHNGYRHHLAEIYVWGKKDGDTAAAVWEEALPFITDPRREYDIRSRVSDATGDHQRTIELVTDWMQLGEQSHEAYLRRATAYGKLGDVEPAIADLKTATELAVTDWDWVDIALEYRRLQQFELELAAYDEAVQLNPNNGVLYHGRAYALSRLDRLQESLKDYNKALELLPRDSRAASTTYRTRAHVLYLLGEFNEAMANFKKALELNPDRTDWVNTIAWVLVTCPRQENRNPEEAMEWVQNAIQRDPKRASSWNTLGVVHYRLGEYEQALTALEKSVELGNDDSLNYFFMAMAHWQLDAQEVAKGFYSKAIIWMNQEAPNHSELLRFRPEAEQLMGMSDERTAEQDSTATDNPHLNQKRANENE